MVLTFLGAVLAWCLVDAKHVLRTDGSHVILMKHPTWQSEILGLWEVLRSDSYIVLLFPLFCKFFPTSLVYKLQCHTVRRGKEVELDKLSPGGCGC